MRGRLLVTLDITIQPEQMRGAVGHPRRQNIAEMLGQPVEKFTEMIAGGINFFAERQPAARIALHHRVGAGEKNLLIDNAKELRHFLARHLLAAIGNNLIQQALAVAHAPFGFLGHQQQRLVVNLYAFFAADVAQLFDNFRQWHAAKIKTLAARENGGGNFVDFGGRKNKHHMRRRLFQRFEQRVERRLREHVDFVDDINFALAARRRVARILAQIADFIDAAIRGAVDFQHVKAAAFGNFLAHRAGVARRYRRAGFTIHGFGEQPRHRSFADAARPGKQVSGGEPILRDRIFQRAGDVFLRHHLRKLSRPPFARQHEVAHSAFLEVSFRRNSFRT